MWLLSNTRLTTLYLGGNGVVHSGYALAEVLSSNQTLTSLELDGSDCPFGSDERLLSTLGDALAANATLTSLGLPSHGLDASAGALLGAALSGNATLTALNLRNNKLGPPGGQALAEALESNTTLFALNVRDNAVGPAVKAALSSILAANAARAEANPPKPAHPRLGLGSHASYTLVWSPLAQDLEVSHSSTHSPLGPPLSTQDLNFLALDPRLPSQLVLGYGYSSPMAGGKLLLHVVYVGPVVVYVGQGNQAVVPLKPGAPVSVYAVYVDPSGAESEQSSVGSLVESALAQVQAGHGTKSPVYVVPHSLALGRASAASSSPESEARRQHELGQALESAHARIAELEAALRVSRAREAPVVSGGDGGGGERRPVSPTSSSSVQTDTTTSAPPGPSSHQISALTSQLDHVSSELRAMESRALAAEERLSALARLGKFGPSGSSSGHTASHALPSPSVNPSSKSPFHASPSGGGGPVESPTRNSSSRMARLRLMVEMSNAKSKSSTQAVGTASPSPLPSPSRPTYPDVDPSPPPSPSHRRFAINGPQP